MPGGTLTLEYYDDGGSHVIEVGAVVTIQESLQKSCTVVPLVSMPMEDTFAVDNRSMKTISIEFKRKQPSSGMTNAQWVQAMESAMNRWQCRSDGFLMTYTPASDNPYNAEFSERGYIKSFTHQCSAGEPLVVKGRLEFHVGTMYCSNSIPSSHDDYTIAQDQFTVVMTDAYGAQPYFLLNEANGVNCIESYTLSGGPQNPFEYLTMVVPRNRLAEVAPALVEEGGIVAGMNRIEINAVGKSSMTVTKCKLSNNRYTITAYCNADRLRGCTFTQDVTLSAEDMVRYILGNRGGTPFQVAYTGDSLVLKANPPDIGDITIAEGTNAWYALQVAAMCMGCMVFFTNNKAYVIDYRSVGSGTDMEDVGNLDLFPTSGNVSFTAGSVSLGDEGRDTVVNSIVLRAIKTEKDGNGDPVIVDEGGKQTVSTAVGNVPVKRENSIAEFYEQSGGIIYVETLKELEEVLGEVEEPPEGEEPQEPPVLQEECLQASTFGNNYLDYRAEPQQSIEFTAKEMHSVRNSAPEWNPQFLPVAWATTIYDSADEVTITNMSDITTDRLPQKLFLSSYERNYPEGTTTYAWGVLANIDLSSSTSQIMSSLGNI